MDFFNLVSVEVLIFLPIILYFLFIKSSGNSKDPFYLIKLYFAKKVVIKAQEKCKKHRKKLLKSNLEQEINFTTQKNYYYQSFSGSDQKGNCLNLKFIIRPNNIAEIVLYFKTANASVYTFPEHEKTYLKTINDLTWKINGLTIETLDPFKRVRIIFNGLLRNVSKNRIEHVQFSFIFNCISAPKFYPEDCNTDLLAKTLACKPWKDSSWKHFLTDHPDGYEQFGALFGFVKGDAFPEEEVLNLPACRSSYVRNNNFILEKEIKIFLAESNGVLINLTLKLLRNERHQLSHGFVFHKNYVTEPIISQDIRIDNTILGKSLPNLIRTEIKVKTDMYLCAINLDKSAIIFQKSPFGSDFLNVSSDYRINKSQGKAVLEFQYYNHKHESIKSPNLRPLLIKRKVDILPEDYVVKFNNHAAQVHEITGGKGTSLALLASLPSQDFLVPDGFVITINAFKCHFEANKSLQDAVEHINEAFCKNDTSKLEDVCSLAVRLISNTSIQPVIEGEILRFLQEIIEDSRNDAIDVNSWAVRSSAIGEDSEELSAAGQNETILGCVTENEILRAVSKCWASLYTYQSVQYRWQHGMPIKSHMAVVVQKMVPADAAGVLFTWHPTNSNPSQMVITSNFGLGESVVSGKCEPDMFILNRNFEGQVSLLDQTIGSKDKVLTLTSNGVEEMVTPTLDEGNFVYVNNSNWSITEKQALKIGAVGVLLENHFGGPRDIEWAFYKDKLYLLQSRPITTLNSWTDLELTHELDSPFITENSLFTVANSGEVFPFALTALTGSTVLTTIDHGMQEYIYKNVELYFLRTLSVFYHRCFLDCILGLYSNARTEQIQMDIKILDLAVFGHVVINEEISQMVRTRLGPMSRLGALLTTYTYWRDSKYADDKLEESRSFVKSSNFHITPHDNALEIYQKISSNDDINLKPSFYHAYISCCAVFWQMVCMMTLVGNEKVLTTKHYVDFANILSSCEDVESAEVPLYIQKIARLIKDEGYSEEFCTIKPELGVDWLNAKCPAALKIFEEFVEKHGHRCIGEFELLSQTWGLNPSLLIPVIQANTKNMQDVAKKQPKTIEQIINELETPVNFVTRKILTYTLTNLRKAVGRREKSKSYLIQSFHKTRLAYHKLAKVMVLEGLLPSENLVFHLTKYELGQVVHRRSPCLINKAMRREKLHSKWNKIKFPELNYGMPQPENDEIEMISDASYVCYGTPVCNGTVQARACVITSLDEIGALEKGDILITYCTDIGWSPYFPMLSGVVTELGGLVSHGAVVAREYGLPCVVGVKNVTKIFKTGDTVYLSCKTGEVAKI
ncbi:hypothetical protein ABEB36_007686 [Hypothenemus hampei]|uniref:Phosphoenolpyruvate synthase n=1 Tax=Hypothenemus hampei TaxID=57062 RepID=A0ABD1EUX4_HYPHA